MPEVGLAERILQGIDYVNSKERSIEQATQQGASGDMITMLEDLPAEAFDSST